MITQFDGQKIDTATDLLARLRKKEPGQNVDVVVQRGSDSKTLTVTLSDTPTQ